ncbi:TRAP transporter large permease [Rhizobium sp. TRM95111]|uniref:TRAP transporter large permease n=1 Tax=Rhizobium alarense TaxID=2846851 RepID=UPI001F2A7FC4|nr:TRAP transporter large permease [Rhizobium alarense]MCF3639658.1 TRAP transporter large permease [Rhizobium alarense]
MSLAFLLCLMVLFLLAAFGAPIAHSMIVAAVVYLAVSGQDLGLAAEQIIQGIYDSFIILAVPLFIVAANIMNEGSISDRLLDFCKAAVGRFRGGLAQVDILVSLIFSGMSGSAIADAAGVGKITINMMVKSGHYTPGFAGAVVAASATIGPIIPPSIPMVMYALVSDASIGYLFLGGVVPGLIMTAGLMAMTTWIAHKRHIPAEDVPPLRELPRITFRALPALLMPVILLAGIYGGATTPTEAAAVAAAYALLLAAFLYRSVSLASLRAIFSESARSSASVGIIIGSALIFNYIVASENVPNQLATYFNGLDVSPLAFLLLVNVLFLLLGCILDATTIILVIVPLFVPVCRALGIDLVHFGVVTVVNCMIGLITPPYGMLLFVISGATGIKINAIVREGMPFLIALLCALAALILFPELVLWLPRQFGYQG